MRGYRRVSDTVRLPYTLLWKTLSASLRSSFLIHHKMYILKLIVLSFETVLSSAVAASVPVVKIQHHNESQPHVQKHSQVIHFSRSFQDTQLLPRPILIARAIARVSAAQWTAIACSG